MVQIIKPVPKNGSTGIAGCTIPAHALISIRPLLPKSRKTIVLNSALVKMVSEDFVRTEFAPWETQNPMPWFEKLPDNVSWHICGTLNPKAGTYNSKAEVIAVFGELMSKVAGPPDCKITNVLPSGDTAVVEMFFHAIAKNGWHFDQELCWVCKYEAGLCVSVRLYVDSAGEVKLFEEN